MMAIRIAPGWDKRIYSGRGVPDEPSGPSPRVVAGQPGVEPIFCHATGAIS